MGIQWVGLVTWKDHDHISERATVGRHDNDKKYIIPWRRINLGSLNVSKECWISPKAWKWVKPSGHEKWEVTVMVVVVLVDVWSVLDFCCGYWVVRVFVEMLGELGNCITLIGPDVEVLGIFSCRDFLCGLERCVEVRWRVWRGLPNSRVHPIIPFWEQGVRATSSSPSYEDFKEKIMNFLFERKYEEEQLPPPLSQ